jgi:hypothetical protein
MPQASERVRKMFLRETNDGIGECKTIIRKEGGTVNNGVITYKGKNKKVLDAIEYLCDEWDFSYDSN